MDIIRRDTARQYRSIRKILRGSEPEVFDHPPEMSLTKKILFTLGITGLVILGSCSLSHAYTVDQLATAIGKAENSKSHPYGIMVKYAHTSPRNACKNTVMHQYRNWLAVGHPGAFLGYLAAHYAPLNASNDPNGLNRNWIRNVSYFLREGL
jgi:hypothetical protein